MIQTEERKDEVNTVPNRVVVRTGEERDIRLCKRNVETFERFQKLVDEQIAHLPPFQNEENFVIFEVLDLMRNHVDDEIAEQALSYLFEKHAMTFKIYIFVSITTLAEHNSATDLD